MIQHIMYFTAKSDEYTKLVGGCNYNNQNPDGSRAWCRWGVNGAPQKEVDLSVTLTSETSPVPPRPHHIVFAVGYAERRCSHFGAT
jgi:hypothetical protein